MVDVEKLLRASLDDDHRNSCTVEIGGEEVTLYATDLTGKDIDWVSRRHPNFHNAPSVAATVDLIIRKTTDADGNAVFNEKHKPLLIRMRLDWISYVRKHLFNDDEDFSDESLGEAEKN